MNDALKQTIKSTFLIPLIPQLIATVVIYFGVLFLFRSLGFDVGWSPQFQCGMVVYFFISTTYRQARLTYQNLKENNLYFLTPSRITLICATFLAFYFVVSYIFLRPVNSFGATVMYSLLMCGCLGFGMWMQERELRRKTSS